MATGNRLMPTPGPWVCAHENAGNGFSIKDIHGRNIGHSAAARSREGRQLPESDRVEEAEAKANGRQMAASPLLVDALSALLDDSERADAGMPLPLEVRFAIKDAAKHALKEALNNG